MVSRSASADDTLGKSGNAGRESSGAPKKERLLDVYHSYFDCLSADSSELLEEAFKLRYQVYCVENAYEDPAENPNGLEVDEYDYHSVHSVLIHRPTGLVAGTVRMILPRGREFPMRKYWTHDDGPAGKQNDFSENAAHDFSSSAPETRKSADSNSSIMVKFVNAGIKVHHWPE